MTVLLCSVFSILRYKEHRNILYLTWTGSSNPQLFRTPDICLGSARLPQATEHFLGKCLVFYYQRQNHFDTYFATLEELIKNTNLKKIIK